MIPKSVLVKLATLGLTAEQAETVGEMLSQVETATKEAAEASTEKSREKARARVQKWKDKQPRNVSKRSETSPNVSKRLTHAEDSSSNNQIPGQEEKEDTAPAAPSDLHGFRAELSELDAERIEAIITLRRARKAQITAFAARVFKADAAKAGLSLAEAVDTCICRNWITVKPEWLENRSATSKANAPPHPRPTTVGDMFREDARRMGLFNDDQLAGTSDRRLEARDGSRQGGGSGTFCNVALPADVLQRIGSG